MLTIATIVFFACVALARLTGKRIFGDIYAVAAGVIAIIMLIAYF